MLLISTCTILCNSFLPTSYIVYLQKVEIIVTAMSPLQELMQTCVGQLQHTLVYWLKL